MITDTRLYKVLTLTGTLPFLASAVIAAGGASSISALLPAAELAGSYGLAILSFLCGTHWATQLHSRENLPTNLLLISNFIVVAVWITYLIPGNEVLMLTTQIIAFLYLLHIDRSLLRGGRITRDYFGVRLLATAIAILSLLVVIYLDLG
jgi:hypothetical protein